MKGLFDFLTSVSVNPEQQLAFATQPSAVMVAAGLSQAEQAVIESKSLNKIAEIFANELTRTALICGDPGPDPTPDPDTPQDEPNSSIK